MEVSEHNLSLLPIAPSRANFLQCRSNMLSSSLKNKSSGLPNGENKEKIGKFLLITGLAIGAAACLLKRKSIIKFFTKGAKPTVESNLEGARNTVQRPEINSAVGDKGLLDEIGKGDRTVGHYSNWVDNHWVANRAFLKSQYGENLEQILNHYERIKNNTELTPVKILCYEEIKRCAPILADSDYGFWGTINVLDGLFTREKIDYRSFLATCYKACREGGTNNKYSLPRVGDISDYTGVDRGNVRCTGDKWHYRLLKNYNSYDIKYRISINAEASQELIDTLDSFVSTTCYYKTPAELARWVGRHDPVTIYLTERPTDEFIKKLYSAVKQVGGIRCTDDVLIGEKVMPGMTVAPEPTSKTISELLARCEEFSPEFAEGAREFMTHNGKLIASYGQYYTVERILKMLQKTK